MCANRSATALAFGVRRDRRVGVIADDVPRPLGPHAARGWADTPTVSDALRLLSAQYGGQVNLM
jgi:hypothetical protein